MAPSRRAASGDRVNHVACSLETPTPRLRYKPGCGALSGTRACPNLPLPRRGWCRCGAARSSKPASGWWSQTLTEAQRRQLWEAIDSRELLIKLVAADFEAELEQIDREIEDELRAG
jgi:hypothetical protein